VKTDLTFKCKQVSIKVNILSFALFPAVILTGRFDVFLIAFVSIAVHELGHIFMACLMGIGVYAVRIMPFGLNAVIEEDSAGTLKQLTVHISGPLVNILVFAVSMIFDTCSMHGSDRITLVAQVNAYLALFNLLPAMPLDGGNILRIIMAARVGFLPANRHSQKITMAFAALMMLVGMVQFYAGGYNFSIIIVSIYILSSSRWNRTEAALMNVKSIFYRRSRLLKKGVYQARDLVVLKTTMVSDIIKNMDFDRFHIIHVLDDDLKLVRSFTEQEIMDAVFENSTDITFGQLVQKANEDQQA